MPSNKPGASAPDADQARVGGQPEHLAGPTSALLIALANGEVMLG